jgi:hypothetical protein
MISDCFRYYKGCEECQRFRDLQLVPAALMHPIIKLWPFRGWALDFIGQINSPSSKGHPFVLVAIDYFTKWTEVVPLKDMTHRAGATCPAHSPASAGAACPATPPVCLGPPCLANCSRGLCPPCPGAQSGRRLAPHGGGLAAARAHLILVAGTCL